MAERNREPHPLPGAHAALLAAYTRTLTEADLSVHTRRTYASRAREYLTWLADGYADHADVDADPLTNPHARDYAVRDFCAHLKTVRGAKPATINNYVSALDHLYGHHLGLGKINTKRERLARWAPRALDQAERRKFCRAIERLASPRDKAICHTLLWAGLRVSELIALDLRDVPISARRAKVIVRVGKGRKYREVPGLHPDARRSLQAWLAVRAEALPEDRQGETALFLTRRGTRISSRRVEEIVAAVGTDAGITVSPHDLRHTLGTMLREQGHPLAVIKEVLGHESIETTARYTIATEAEAAEAMESLTIAY